MRKRKPNNSCGDAPREYGPHKTLYNRWKRWSDKGIFAQMMIGLAADHGEEKTVMIEIMFGRLKDWRRVATRYDRCPKIFLSAIALAVLVIYRL